MPDGSSLSLFLQKAKQKYLNDVRATPSKGSEWTVVMGNEAGDLDSVASSIAYAWHRSEIENKPSIPLIQTARADLALRPENLYALQLAGISDPGEWLLCTTDVEDIMKTKSFPVRTFALVDHNRLGDAFLAAGAEGDPNAAVVVVAVIDHHEDEHWHEEADPRHVAPAGSCASHVANIFSKEGAEMPEELATLLLSAILIDTGGLRAGGKALQVDHAAAAYLIPRSTLTHSPALNASSALSSPSMVGVADRERPAIKHLSAALDVAKSDVSHLGAWDLLRRDYKEYTYTLPWHAGSPSIKAGLATVPVQLQAFGANGKLEEEAQRWMAHRGLSILGVLTSFRDSDKIGKGAHRREMAWLVRDGGDTAGSQAPVQADDIAARLWQGLEENEDIRVKKHKKMSLSASVRGRVYEQGNANATRKVTAPLLKNIMENSEYAG